MAKTLVIAEKPSVGRDLARVLPGPFESHKSSGERNDRWLEGPDHVITWAIGHLVQLAEPDEYDKKFKRWKFDDLPITPETFKLVVRDDSSRKQMTVVRNLLGRDDVGDVINACDAGREGELIFRWIFEKAGGKQPVKRLWLSSMTEAAIRDAFGHLRDEDELETLAEAARSRSEADWIVGMNATRAATIRLRSSFDGAVSLGRVQTPTLAILAAREEEIRAFVPEAYWLVDARFEAERKDGKERRYTGRLHRGVNPRLDDGGLSQAIVDAVTGSTGTISKLEKTRRKERAPMLYDLTTLQREANSRFGFSARRTLGAAQRCYEEHKALTYPRTSSRYLTSDMISDIKPTAGTVGRQERYADAAAYVQGLEKLPLGRVVNNEKVGDHHAIIPTNSAHPVAKMSDDDKKIYDMVVRRFLAVFHPDAEFENTRIETTVEVAAGTVREVPALAAVPQGPDAPKPTEVPAEGATVSHDVSGSHVFRTRGKVLLVPGWRGVYGELAEGGADDDEDAGGDQTLPKLSRGERADVLKATSLEKVTKPPRRYSDASLLGAMETAGKLVDDDEAREAMKESGIGTPATRAAIIERLIDVGYVERDARSLVVSEKGRNVIRLLAGHPLTSPSLTGDWEQRLAKIESGEQPRRGFMKDIEAFAHETVKVLDENLKNAKIERANLGPCPVCGNDIRENRKGFSCWSKDDPGCGFVIWKGKASKQLTAPIVRELVQTGRTAKQVTGFKGRSGRPFRAKLMLQQSDEGKWRVEFDEAWARDGARTPAPEVAEAADAAAAAGGAAAA